MPSTDYVPRRSDWLLCAPGVLLISLGVYDAFLANGQPSSMQIWIGRGEIVLGGCLWWYSMIQVFRVGALLDLPECLAEMQARWADVESVRREYYKARTSLQALHAEVLTESESVRITRETAVRIEQELIDSRQRQGNALREVEEWQNATVRQFEAIELLLSHADLNDDYRESSEKIFEDVSRIVAPLGFDVIRPQPGDVFDDRIHRFVGEKHKEKVPEGDVVECSAWGFRMGGKLIKNAEVFVASLSEPASESSDSESEKAVEEARTTNDEDSTIAKHE